MAADLVKYAHVALVAYAVAGCALPEATLPFHAIMAPALTLTWRFYGGCPLTHLECHLRGEDTTDRRFAAEYLERCGVHVPRCIMDAAEHAVIWASWGVTVERLLSFRQ